MKTTRIAVTGLGTWNVGFQGWQDFWRSLCSGNGDRAYGALDAVDHLPLDRQLRHADRVGKLALGAVEMALEDAEIERGSDTARDIGIALGTGYGCLSTNADYLRTILSKGMRFGNPVVFQNTVPNAATGYVSVGWGLRGPTATFASGSVAGLEALDFAARQIAEGRCSAMVVCAADQLSPEVVEMFNARRELSPEGRPRPCDRRRDGTALAEGGCALVVEGFDAAIERGAPRYAEYLGCGRAFRERPSAALAAAIDEVLDGVEDGARGVDAAFLAASGSREHDAACARGLRGGLGESGSKLPVTCTKGLLGETMGSAASFDTAAAALALVAGHVPPVSREAEADPDLDLELVVGRTRSLDLDRVLVTALGDDGNAFAAVLGRAA